MTCACCHVTVLCCSSGDGQVHSEHEAVSTETDAQELQRRCYHDDTVPYWGGNHWQRESDQEAIEILV